MIFENEGRENTAKTVELAVKAAKEQGIKELVVATSTGGTPPYLYNYDLEGIHVTIVTTAYGYGGPGKNRLPEEKRAEFIAKGYDVVTAAHALTGVERSLGTPASDAPGNVIAATLKLISRGTKVCVEIGAMACDAGCIAPGEPIVAVAGSGGGADTAVIMRPANTHKLFDTRIDEFICKPKAALVTAPPEKK